MDIHAFAPADLEEMENWLLERLGQYLPDQQEPVDPHRELGEYGLDSIAVVAFAADVEDRLAISVDPTAVWDHPTIAQLAKYLLAAYEELPREAA
ncbi:acyl carrier protein [Streptomyces sp. RLB1-33]|jgi:acyl carrier protein|uniref:acyl carrier protein n=1 Tax=Streptomyces mirabilis TaxID=68239 RepID=UPI00143E959D|nr:MULTISPECIES: acyl carrier protein [Streptomyces]QIY73921.1 acyl carrier protein [Streptomyces sp. RLB1-33]QUW79126.1 acyl carrier protein [Streptomyces mirabilis]